MRIGADHHVARNHQAELRQERVLNAAASLIEEQREIVFQAEFPGDRCVLIMTGISFYGDSFTDGTGASDGAHKFSTLVANELGMTEHNYGAGGARQNLNLESGTIPYILLQVYQSTTVPRSAPYASAAETSVIQVSINNLNLTEFLANSFGIVTKSLSRAIQRIRAGGGWEGLAGAPFTYAGTVDDTIEADANTGTGYKKAWTNGSTWTLVLPSDFPGGEVDVYGPKTASYGGTWTVTLDGSAHGSIVNSNATATFGSEPWVYKLSGLTSGTHTIVGTLSAVATVEQFNGADFKAGTSPLIIVLNTCRTTTYPGGTHTTTDTDVNNSNAAVATMLATDYPSDPKIVFVDIDSVIAKNAGRLAVDGIHPNDTGHQLIADAIVSAINAATIATHDVYPIADVTAGGWVAH